MKVSKGSNPHCAIYQIQSLEQITKPPSAPVSSLKMGIRVCVDHGIVASIKLDSMYKVLRMVLGTEQAHNSLRYYCNYQY